MRRFLYLNNDSLHSYISQISDGLPTNAINFNKNLAEEKNYINDYRGISESSLSIEKKLYDEAFDKLRNHLNSEKILLKENLSVGDFIELKNEMFIVDLEYYKNIFSNDDVLDFIKNSETENKFVVESQNVEITGNGNKAGYDLEKLRREIKKQVDSEYEGVKKIINAILNIVPYNKFGIMGDYLIVLDDEYFRDKTNVVAYKYGGEMTMLGYLTNIVSNNKLQNDTNVFTTFPAMINTFMLSFFNKSEIKIIHPVAIYY